MKKNKVLKFLGISFLFSGLILNIQYALFDYGLGTNNLSYQLLAQTGSGSESGDSSGNSSGDSSGGTTSPVYFTRVDSDCEYYVYGDAGAEVKLLGIVIGKIGATGEFVYIVKDGKTNCIIDGNELCETKYCPVINFN